MAAGYLTGALLPALLVGHLLATQAFARHAPGVEIMYNAPTNDGPSPATGHGNQPSPHMEINGDPSSVAMASESRDPLSARPCQCNHGHPPATDESQLDTAGISKPSSVAPEAKPLP
ncbi:hypothetical protein HU200_021393 [Digitaria exilis]|uniref:Uncharacterized protein n=1 Tax=Digitaria exilis TaxID=1010633 RepID=A0A835KFW5_9POAL|nr:hypothetical protein HU200_021393 [Digitaria exilis]